MDSVESERFEMTINQDEFSSHTSENDVNVSVTKIRNYTECPEATADINEAVNRLSHETMNNSKLMSSAATEQANMIVADLNKNQDISKTSAGIVDVDSTNVKASDLLKQQRASKRESEALKRREETDRKRREREEQLKLERETAIRLEQQKLSMEEEGRRRIAERKLEKEKFEEEERQRSAKERESISQMQLQLERDRRMKEEYARKLEEMKKEREAEARLKLAMEEARRQEEEARQREEEKKLLEMEESVRIKYLKEKEEEEKRLGLEREAERLRREEVNRLAIEESMRIAEELARRQECLRQQLEYNRELHSEASDLTIAQRLTRAFLFSYFQLLKCLNNEDMIYNNTEA